MSKQVAVRNYKQYWNLLKDKFLLRLEFKDVTGSGRSALEYNVQLWKSGISKSKNRDGRFCREFPDARLAYETTYSKADCGTNAVVLTCRLTATPVQLTASDLPTDFPSILDYEDEEPLTPDDL